MEKPDQQLTDQEALESSKQNPNLPFKSQSGNIAFQGKLYSKKDIDDLILVSNGLQNPFIRFVAKVLSLPERIFKRKKI